MKSAICQFFERCSGKWESNELRRGAKGSAQRGVLIHSIATDIIKDQGIIPRNFSGRRHEKFYLVFSHRRVLGTGAVVEEQHTKKSGGWVFST